jgi:spore coat polysaccharide biosynthesis protein SpsF
MIGAIVQARTGSSRLPGKVLLPAAGKPLLTHLLERLARCRSLETVIVATSNRRPDDAIAELCSSLGTLCFRGSEHDVLDRYYQAALANRLHVIVRITGDCPLANPELIDQMVEFFLCHSFDLVTNRHPLTYVDGFDLDVMSIESLEHAWRHATETHQREHTIPYFWEAGLRVQNLEDPGRLFERYRLTLDYPEDYQVIRQVFDALYRPGETPTAAAVLAYLEGHPEVACLNRKYIPAAAGT